jgi:hypothetical protein
MFKSVSSLCPIFAISLACVIPPADQSEGASAAACSTPNNEAVLSVAHILEPDDDTHPAHCVEKSAAAKYPVSAMTACVYEFSATTPKASLGDKSTAKEFLNSTRSENSNDR